MDTQVIYSINCKVEKSLYIILKPVLACLLQIRVVNAFQMDLDACLDSYDKRSRPSVISLHSLQAQKMGVSKRPTLASSPEAAETTTSSGLGRGESIPYADE